MNRKHLFAAAALIVLLLAVARFQHLNAIAAAPNADVLIAYEPAETYHVRADWEPALQRAHIAHEWVALPDFGVLDGTLLAHRFALIVIPRALSRAVPDTARAELLRFVDHGGTVLTLMDAPSLTRLLQTETGAVHRPLLRKS